MPAAEVVPTVSPCATSFAVAVSSPERCICQLSWSRTQPEYIAYRGTSGIAVSIDSDGSVRLPERNSWVQGPLPLVDRLAEGGLQPEAEGRGIDRHHDVAVGGHRVLDRRGRIAAVAEKLRADQRLLGAERGAGERHPGVAAGRAVP